MLEFYLIGTDCVNLLPLIPLKHKQHLVCSCVIFLDKVKYFWKTKKPKNSTTKVLFIQI